MKLLATLGATYPPHRQRYWIGDREYHCHFSFEALREHYRISDADVVLLGTAQTREILGEMLDGITLVEVDPNDLDDIFHKTLLQIEAEIIVDLTQSFRSVPFGAFLALSFSKSLGKYAKEIYYAQARSHECNPAREACEFHFVSLLRYDRIVDAARMINTFVETLLVLDRVDLADRELRKLRGELERLSAAIYDNDVDRAIERSATLIDHTESLSRNDDYEYLHEHLQTLNAQLLRIASCAQKHESEKLLCMSAYLLEKDIRLHAITMLYESMVAFLDEEIEIRHCNKVKKRGKWRSASTYERRNCLKKELKECGRLRAIPRCEEFGKTLKSVDKLRNIAAHGFTSDRIKEDLEKEMRKVVGFLQEVYPQRLSAHKGIEKLQRAFGSR